MVPRKFNIVEFGGFDLAGQYGEALPGIYDKIIDAHWNCVYIMCFGLKFGGVDIAPQYMTPELFSDHIMLNGIISIDQNDVITIPGIEPPAPLPVIQSLLATENRVYETPEGVDGFAPVTVSVSGDLDILDLCSPEIFIYSQKSGKPPNLNVYPGGGIGQRTFEYVGNEYSGYIYDTNIIDDCSLVLLADLSQNSSLTSANLSDAISNYSGVVLQGIYSKQRKSAYNTTMLYVDPKLNKSYWAGMKDRNQSYSCYVTFTSGTEATLAGNKQVIIYGIP